MEYNIYPLDLQSIDGTTILKALLTHGQGMRQTIKWKKKEERKIKAEAAKDLRSASATI